MCYSAFMLKLPSLSPCTPAVPSTRARRMPQQIQHARGVPNFTTGG